MVMDSIRKHHPEIEIELVTMKTTGDMILDRTLDKVGGKGLFVKELDKALLEERVDITVHSFKDLPMEVLEKLPIVATSKREVANDVLILPKGQNTLDPTKPIGCASQRRTVQLKKLFPESFVAPVRGNVLTRLDKLDRGEYSALVLAYAGVKRLGLEDRISRIFTTEEMIPSACQGIVVVQARQGFDTSFLREFHDQESFEIGMCERAFVASLEGGCSSPIAAYATKLEDDIAFTGMYVAEDGQVQVSKIKSSKDEACTAAAELAQAFKGGN